MEDALSSFVLELHHSGRLRFIPTTGVISEGSWKQKENTIQIELNKGFVKMIGVIEGDRIQGMASSNKGNRRTWSATKQPYVSTTAAPDYPALARAAGVTGSVLVDVTIDEMGLVMSVHYYGGHPLLRTPSENAARRYRFQPATEEGSRSARLTFIFTQLLLNESSPRFIRTVSLSPYQIEVRRGRSVIQTDESWITGEKRDSGQTAGVGCNTLRFAFKYDVRDGKEDFKYMPGLF